MLTPQQIMSVKRHLGYSTVAPSLYPLAGVWLNAQQILTTLPTETETEVTSILTRLDNLETKIDGAPARLAAAKVGTIALNADELPQLWAEIRRWRRELSVLTGLPDLRAGRSMMVV